ncbi:MAG: hypothetical protein WKH64_03535 [Chloroflexia bacterium]
MADYAAAVHTGPEAARNLLAPLVPTLYSFFARRTADREDAEDMLVETMVRARADVLRRPTSGARLLGRLIGLATHALAANLAMDREAESGLKPNWSSGDANAQGVLRIGGPTFARRTTRGGTSLRRRSADISNRRCTGEERACCGAAFAEGDG